MTGFLSEIGAIAATPAAPHDEPPTLVRRRRVVVVVVLILGATLLGISLRSTPGEKSFFALTFALAAVWAIGARLSGPLHFGFVTFRGKVRRPVLTGAGIGVALGAVFIAGGLVCREIGPVRDYIVQVLEYANYGALWLVVLITVINGVAEEMFFRGALYSSLGRFHPEVVSTIVYALAVSAAGNPMLGFAGIILGAVCAYERRITGGVLAPMLTHFFWGLVMVLALPPMFGV
ncbi:CPBP family intramembrane glutamic endopeptidase [Mycolicibacterium hodleri]|uniref:CPBP family intramembrane metalloprotease n=1 Tax=Mycolicibacterium hodleri TaxID=49897 RepID=A0A502EES3_9MYCO|nr:CPBP family intramembrane glutamic endopeptidase [Mycolicibacterium hodleri]TPG35957.1 CPBP family intramembrane metalloprotease [Mycolicibacterium hodleri]